MLNTLFREKKKNNAAGLPKGRKRQEKLGELFEKLGVKRREIESKNLVVQSSEGISPGGRGVDKTLS